MAVVMVGRVVEMGGLRVVAVVVVVVMAVIVSVVVVMAVVVFVSSPGLALLRRFEDHESPAVQGVIRMRPHVAAETIRQAGGADGALHRRLEEREGVNHRGHEHVAGETAHRIKPKVHQA